MSHHSRTDDLVMSTAIAGRRHGGPDAEARSIEV
jgi:hypothetical protein